MDLLIPEIGLTFWTIVIFLIFFFLLSKFAWKPIIKGIKSREESIASALSEAEKAREEMSALKAENEEILRKAREERESILQEAKQLKDKIVNEARTEASEEATRMIENAREQIQAEKMAAVTDLKNQVGILAIDVAEKLLREKLGNQQEQKQVVDRLIGELNLN